MFIEINIVPAANNTFMKGSGSGDYLPYPDFLKEHFFRKAGAAACKKKLCGRSERKLLRRQSGEIDYEITKPGEEKAGADPAAKIMW